MTPTAVAENLFLNPMFMRVYSTLLQVDNLNSYRRPNPTTASYGWTVAQSFFRPHVDEQRPKQSFGTMIFVFLFLLNWCNHIDLNNCFWEEHSGFYLVLVL